MLPVLELRASIPLGLFLGLDPWRVYLLSVLGNITPVPIILLFFRKILEILKNYDVFSFLLSWIYRTGEKRSEIVRRYGPLGLTLFVAIPLPITGAWTGSLIAVLLNLPFQSAFLSIFFGVLIAGFLVLLASLGVISIL